MKYYKYTKMDPLFKNIGKIYIFTMCMPNSACESEYIIDFVSLVLHSNLFYLITLNIA